jgi:hypothetical protein
VSVDYKLIADNDPAGELETAFAAMAAETVTSTPEVMVTYRKIGEVVGLAASAELEVALKNTDNGIPSWVNAALNGGGVNVNDPQVSDVLEALVPDNAEAITAIGVVTTAKYKSLKMRSLSKARLMRAEGRI